MIDLKKVLTWLTTRSLVVYVVAAIVLILGVTGVAAETGTLSASPSPSASATAEPAAASSQANVAAAPDAGGGANIVQVINRADEKFKMDGKVKLDQINGPNAAPKNEALAWGTCTNCQTLAVALEINLIKRANNVQPSNVAVALNYKCTNCQTHAIAYQYNITVEDPSLIPDNVKKLVQQMNDEIKDIKASGVSYQQALDAVRNVVGQFSELGQYLTTSQDHATDQTSPNAGPPPADTASPAPSPTPADSASPSPSATVTLSPSASTSP